MTLDQAKKTNRTTARQDHPGLCRRSSAGGYNVPAGNRILAMMNDSAVMGTDLAGGEHVDPASFHE